MFNPLKAMMALDAVDPRQHQIVDGLSASRSEILLRHKIVVETILRICTDHSDHPIRQKGQAVLLAIEAERRKEANRP